MTDNNNDNADMTTAPPPPPEEEIDNNSFSGRPGAAQRSSKKKSRLFSTMADYPWPFMLFLPIVFALIIAFGWGWTDDKIEDEVAKQWIAQDGAYASDQAYAKSLGVDDLDSTNFLAMATTRDGKNILTADRLEAFRQRMQEAESVEVSRLRVVALLCVCVCVCVCVCAVIGRVRIRYDTIDTTDADNLIPFIFFVLNSIHSFEIHLQIEYKGVTYTWDDLCASNPAPVSANNDLRSAILCKQLCRSWQHHANLSIFVFHLCSLSLSFSLSLPTAVPIPLSPLIPHGSVQGSTLDIYEFGSLRLLSIGH